MSLHYLQNLDPDLKQSLLEQLKTLWTHTSTALEGNSLTLGETHAVLTEGLTINGKPLKDHNEVLGHARAHNLMENFIQTRQPFTQQNIFDLHKAIQSYIVIDAYQPMGAWKNQPNSTVVILDEKQMVNDTYAKPEDVENLMTEWIKQLNLFIQNTENPLKAYTWLHAGFVRIHPFADGNGRLARLLANIPVILSGSAPLIIPKEKRLEYIHTLAKWQFSIGRPSSPSLLVIENKEYKIFEDFCYTAWEPAKKLVSEIWDIQNKRK